LIVSASAEIITIGTELLLGDIVDTNAAAIGRALRAIGLDLYRTTSVGDNADRIAAAVAEACGRAQVILTTGGLGPTVDDATRDGIARALGRDPVFHPELWDQIVRKFAQYGRTPTENNRRQAFLPEGAQAIENPVGTAPAFLVETATCVIIALPGVPGEMQSLLQQTVLPYLRHRLGTTALIKSLTVRTAGAGESWIDDRIQDLEQQVNPTVGLAAHPGRVDIRITAKADSEQEVDSMLAGVEAELRSRLGPAVYGTDDDRLAGVVATLLGHRGWGLSGVEAGTGGKLAAQLADAGGTVLGILVQPVALESAALEAAMKAMQDRTGAKASLGLSLQAASDRQRAILIVSTPDGSSQVERTYGGPPKSAPAWAASLLLDSLRRRLTEQGQTDTRP
jgi:nicotinamide-nucleotide amidase